MAEPLVLLHGFAGTRRAWDQVTAQLGTARYRPLAIDLPGHGARRDVEPSFEAAVDAVLAVTDEPFALCGYSMGGRIAMHAALAAPERISRLILVAASPGIEDDEARERRRAADDELACFCEQATIEQFADRWQAQELFADTPSPAAAIWRDDLLRNEPRALARALRANGTGAMAPLWNRLAELRMPVTVIAGGRDEKFVALAARMAEALPACDLVVIPGAGHGLTREAPVALAAAIEGSP